MQAPDVTVTRDLARIAAEVRQVRARHRPGLPTLQAWLRSLKSASDFDRDMSPDRPPRQRRFGANDETRCHPGQAVRLLDEAGVAAVGR
jgi:hypothetical protein